MTETVSTYSLPLPRFYSDGSREFYEAARNHELRIQRCAECSRFRFPPQPMCPACHSLLSEWAPVTGTGRVHTFTVVEGFEPRSVPMFSWPDDQYPISVVVVQLDDADGACIVSNVVECPTDELEIGMPVEVVFDDVTDEITLPKFRPVR